MAHKKTRYVVWRCEGEEEHRILASEDAASILSDLFVEGRLKPVRRTDVYARPAPGDVIFDSQRGTLQLNDGREVVQGRPAWPCPDCGENLVLTKKFYKNIGPSTSPWFYLCKNKDNGCGGVAAARSDGTMMGKPADAATRNARKLTTAMFERLWREAPELVAVGRDAAEYKQAENAAKARAYRWLAAKMRLQGIKTGHIPSMDIPMLRIAYRACRDASLEEVYTFGGRAEAS